MLLESLIGPSNVAVLKRIRIISVVVQRASVVLQSSELSISSDHDAAAQKKENLENYPKDQNCGDEGLIKAKVCSRG